MISGYSATPHHVKNLFHIVGKRLNVHGFVVADFFAKYKAEFDTTIPPLVAAGAIRYKEHRVRGLERAGQAILDVQTGVNFGKCVVVVAEE